MSIIRQSIVVIFFLQQIDGFFQRENLAVRHPCYSINKRLEPFITWTEKLASSQYQGESNEGQRKSSLLFNLVLKDPKTFV